MKVLGSGNRRVRLAVVVVLTGLGAGVGGILVTELLHLIQHLAYGYTEDTFLPGVERASRVHRVAAMAVGGLLTGLGWFLLRRYRGPLFGVRDALRQRTRLPVPETVLDAVLQIAAVGFGASLGREGAPRQIGAALGGWCAQRAGLDEPQQRLLLACGAGAGLAAVYNVPLGGTLFTLEILLSSMAAGDVLAALVTSVLATGVAWTVLGNRPTYLVSALRPTLGLLGWAVVIGPVAALVGVAFLRLAAIARRYAATGWRIPIATTVVFAALGALAGPFPQLLGNGKGVAQVAFAGGVTVLLAACLAALKPIATAACLASGAIGGLLTPSLATGALLGVATGQLWSLLWPGTPIAAFAVLAAAAVLTVTQRAPLCAIMLVMEFTHTGIALLVPMMLAVAGAAVTAQVLPGSAWTSSPSRPAQ